MNKSAGVLAGVAMLASGCAHSLRSPVLGVLYESTKAGEIATSNTDDQASGEACATSILGIVALGDASIDAAMEEGGLTSISYVDSEHTGILGIYATYCTVVVGKGGREKSSDEGDDDKGGDLGKGSDDDDRRRDDDKGDDDKADDDKGDDEKSED
jgi:hypothetical protein